MNASGFSVGDVFAVSLERFKLFFPCQILDKDEEKGLLVLVFNNFQSEVPTIENAKNWRPLYNDHHYWKKELFCGWITDFERLKPIFIENISPMFPPKEKEIGRWSVSHREQIESQYLWQQLDKEIQTNFKSTRRPKIWIREPQNQTFFDELKQNYPYSYEIESDFFCPQLIDYAENTPMIIDLHLSGNDCPKVVDISKTHLRKLCVNVGNVEKLILNSLLADLVLSGDFSKLKTIECPFNGKLLSLQLNLGSSEIGFSGLEEVRSVRIFSNKQKTLDIQNIATFLPKIEATLINGGNATLLNISELKRFSKLKDLWITDCYGFDDFPKNTDLPLLERLWLWSVPKTAGEKAKKEFGKLPDFEVRQLRSESWLKANLGNPFSNWDGREGTSAAVAKKAMSAYTNTYKKLDKKGITREEKEALLIEFVQIFNQIDKKHSIDTLEREEIWATFCMLAQLTDFTTKEIEAIFENHRDF